MGQKHTKARCPFALNSKSGDQSWKLKLDGPERELDYISPGLHILLGSVGVMFHGSGCEQEVWSCASSLSESQTATGLYCSYLQIQQGIDEETLYFFFGLSLVRQMTPHLTVANLRLNMARFLPLH